MGKLVGIVLILGGVWGLLYSWICSQKETQIRREEVILFLQKTIFAMDAEKIHMIDFFETYESRDEILQRCIREIASRLRQNIYPKGQLVWEEVLKEEEQNWNLDKDTFDFILRAGDGFFGRNREENICLLEKTMQELEIEQKRAKEKDAKERKVWIPVSMLGGMMLTILFI